MKILGNLLMIIFGVALCYLVSAIVGSIMQYGTVTIEGLYNTYTMGIFTVAVLGLGIYGLLQLADGKSFFGLGGNKEKKKKQKDKKPDEQFFDSEWLTERELDKKYDGCLFRELYLHEDGVPIRAQLQGNGIHINLKHEIWHTMVVGTTGSGKSAGFIDPTIQILGHTKSKPSLVIMDVKGELFMKHSIMLREQGYNIVSFNLRDPFSSTRWNPMSKPYKSFHRALHLREEVCVHRNENPADLGLRVIAPVYNYEWYEIDKIAFPNKEDLESYIIATQKMLNDSAYEDLNDIAHTLCPVSEGNDKSWEMGARDFVLGIMLAMLEDSAFPELGMTEDRYNFFNLYKICNTKDPDPDKQFGTLQKYLQGRSKLSNAVSLAAPIVNNSPVTARSFFGMIANAVNVFADSGVCFATSADEMDFTHFADKPNALFIKVPDEKETRYPIAQMCIVQLYKTLVEVANHNPPKLTLPRHVYFILDEFANMPKIPRFESIITVGRSRGICLMLVVQSYPQVSIKYGEAAADVIKSNCNIHVYLGTMDQKTKEEFSTRCGQTSVDSKSTSESKNKEDTTKSTSTQKVSRALITPDELGYLKDGEMIVSMFKEKAIKSQFTFAYKADHIYNMTPASEEFRPPRYINEEYVLYDIKERNRKILNKSREDDFDF